MAERLAVSHYAPLSTRPPSPSRPLAAPQVMQLLLKGNKQRMQEPTAANQTSSRSHAVLQVTVRQKPRIRNIMQEVRVGRLFMIDLAGSERASQVRGGSSGGAAQRCQQPFENTSTHCGVEGQQGGECTAMWAHAGGRLSSGVERLSLGAAAGFVLGTWQ